MINYQKTPLSVLTNIIKLFIVDNANAQEIAEKLKNKYHLEKLTSQTIYKILYLIRKYITHYYNDVYFLEKIYDGIGGKFAVDMILETRYGSSGPLKQERGLLE